MHRRQRTADDHQPHAEDRNALVAEGLAEQAARIGDHDAGKQVEPDEQSKLRIIDLEIGYDEWGKRPDRLELEPHHGSRQE
jgi:hypothetical protein